MSDIWSWQPEQASRTDQPVSLLHLEGPGSLRFLHGQTTAAIENVATGSWIPSCCTSPTGRMRAVVDVWIGGAPAEQEAAAGQGAWLMIHGPSQSTGLALHQCLDRVLFPADRVKLGPLEAATWITPIGSGLEPFLHREGAALAKEIAALTCLGPMDQERWRIQQGLPAEPAEINDHTNPFELGLADRVSLGKGCYLGQETLAKLATYDGVKQQLRRWHCRLEDPSSSPLLAPGQVLWSNDQVKAGLITSSLAIGSGQWIGLALVRRQALGQECLMARDVNQLADPKPLGGQLTLYLSQAPSFSAIPIGAGGNG
ncbi:tRNA-modifying protein YgfZ [Cyanobium sp. HWJ4-Hawea]|uniref:CAF17-like 4Fe-4S cluster assembly/insertion protein YgfZ n=1 Tax=Cyanobium sp. HWJ4-Hawea TaxID=2823713 RepID=UPI0020CC3909|nr:folate-binding protein YgfZ [Cyanobium sp. HWJ4-Hawea]MCP9809454.1 tRNA-modifying protein YgfZ [Cyanobium sp. HWJ4-Hawea]